MDLAAALIGKHKFPISRRIDTGFGNMNKDKHEFEKIFDVETLKVTY